MKNTIAERIFDFLKDSPPFDVLSKEQLSIISKNVKVINLFSGKYDVFRTNKKNTRLLSFKDRGSHGVFHNKCKNAKSETNSLIKIRAVFYKMKLLMNI